MIFTNRILLRVVRAGLIFFCLFIVKHNLLGQERESFKVTYTSNFILNGVNQETPFWGWANQHGLIQSNSTNVINSFNISSPSKKLFSNLQAGFESELFIRASNSSTIFFPRFFAKFEIENFDMKIGRFYRTQVLGQNKEYTIGSLLVGSNANAFTGYNIRAKRFLSVPLLKGYIKYKFSFGDYITPDNRYVSDVLFHSKDFYVQIHVGKYRLSAGIIHNAFWGGNSPRLGKLPSGFRDYGRIVFNNSGGNNALPGEQKNRLGNSVSGYDYAMSYEFESFDFQISKLFFIEDRPASRHRSPWDGQWNATIDFKENRILDYIVYDHVNTKRQDAKDFEPYGRADYYNHYIYQSGFSNHGYVLGNPLIKLEFDRDGISRSVNNVLVAHHVGVKGRINENIAFSQRATYSRNYGNCFDQLAEPGRCNYEPEDDVELIPLSELRKDSYYFSSEFIYRISELNETEASLILNYDFGELGKRFGIVIGFKTQIL